jgi:hypothetical protein
MREHYRNWWTGYAAPTHGHQDLHSLFMGYYRGMSIQPPKKQECNVANTQQHNLLSITNILAWLKVYQYIHAYCPHFQSPKQPQICNRTNVADLPGGAQQTGFQNTVSILKCKKTKFLGEVLKFCCCCYVHYTQASQQETRYHLLKHSSNSLRAQ